MLRPALLVALAVLTTLRVVSKAARAVPRTGTSPKADFTVAVASFTTLDRLLPRLLPRFRLVTAVPSLAARSTLADPLLNIIAHAIIAANCSGRGAHAQRNSNVTQVADP